MQQNSPPLSITFHPSYNLRLWEYFYLSFQWKSYAHEHKLLHKLSGNSLTPLSPSSFICLKIAHEIKVDTCPKLTDTMNNWANPEYNKTTRKQIHKAPRLSKIRHHQECRERRKEGRGWGDSFKFKDTKIIQ